LRRCPSYADVQNYCGYSVPSILALSEHIGSRTEKTFVIAPIQACVGIYPLTNVFIRKVKILKAPKFDMGKLMEVHGDFTEEIGTKVERTEEPKQEEELVGA